MLSRLLLVLAGLLAGLWLRDPGGTLYDVGFPVLALIALLFAVAATPPSMDGDARARLTDAYRQWLDAWYRRCAATEREPAADEALRSATRFLALLANTGIVKSLSRAIAQDLSPAAVAQLTLDVRRSLGSGSATLRPSDFDALLAPMPRPAPNVRADAIRPATAAASAASFIT